MAPKKEKEAAKSSPAPKAKKKSAVSSEENAKKWDADFSARMGLVAWRILFFTIMAFNWYHSGYWKSPMPPPLLRHCFEYDHLGWVADLMPTTEEAFYGRHEETAGDAAAARALVALGGSSSSIGSERRHEEERKKMQIII